MSTVEDDLAYVHTLAHEIAGDGAEPVDEDVVEVLDYFGLEHSAELSNLVGNGLATAAEFYKIAADFEHDPRTAFDINVDQGSYSTAAAAYWRQEFSDRGDSECETLVERLKRAQ